MAAGRINLHFVASAPMPALRVILDTPIRSDNLPESGNAKIAPAAINNKRRRRFPELKSCRSATAEIRDAQMPKSAPYSINIAATARHGVQTSNMSDRDPLFAISVTISYGGIGDH